MSSPIGIFITSVVTAVSLRMAGSYVPALAPITVGSKILKEIDGEMEKSAAQSVLSANRNQDGSTPNIVMLTFYNGTQTKKVLEQYVDKQGGTAWFQAGSNRRLQAFWHHSRTFKPKEAQGCYLGHVVRGTKDGI